MTQHSVWLWAQLDKCFNTIIYASLWKVLWFDSNSGIFQLAIEFCNKVFKFCDMAIEFCDTA